MENSQLAQPALQDEGVKLNAERHFRQFWNQVWDPNPKGIFSEVEKGKKIFSFETYLREIGEGEHIETYCSHIKAEDLISKMLTGTRNSGMMRIVGSLQVMLFFSMTFLPGIFLYLLVVALLATFDISFWGWSPAVLFAFSGPVLVALFLFLKLRGERQHAKAGKWDVLNIIKNFDNDEITFLRNQNKLFVEQKEQ